MRAPSAAALDAAEPDELAPADAEAPIAGAGSAGIRTIEVSMSVMLCAVSLCSSARSAAVHCGPPWLRTTLSGPTRTDTGLAGIRGGGLVTTPAALSEVVFA